MKIDQSKLSPIMGEWLNHDNSIVLDFSRENQDLEALDLSTPVFDRYVFNIIEENNKKYGHGGYLENRIIYQRSKHFQKGESRSMHLGIDVWSEAFHPLHCPFDSIVHSFNDNDNFGDYGPTIILEHHYMKQSFYTLYGHLSRNSLKGLRKGQFFDRGKSFCELGPYPENGDWPPHLHLQVITNMDGNEGDFPGVCAPSELEHYKSICPDPSGLVLNG